MQGKNDEVVSRDFGGIDRIPTVYIYDRQGRPVHTFIHQQGAKKMHATSAELAPYITKAVAGD